MREDVLHSASARQRAESSPPSPPGGSEAGSVRVRKAALLAAATIVVTTHVATSARADTGAEAASRRTDTSGVGNAPEPLQVDARPLARGGTLVMSPSESAASVSVCVAPLRPEGETVERLEAASRGGVESYFESDGLGVWCVALPPSELAYGLWLSARTIATVRSPTAARSLPDQPGLSRAAAIALEGATVALEPQGSAFTVVVAGHADRRAVEEIAERYFGKESEPALRARPLSPVQTSERMSMMHGDVPSSTARYAWITPQGSEDEAGIRIALEVLGGGERARLPRLLVGEHLARSIASWTYPVAGGTLSGLLVVPSSRVSIDRLRRFVDGALKQMRLVGPSRRELIRGKQRLLLEAYRAWEDPVSRGRLLASYELLRGGAEQAPRDMAAIERATADTVRKAVRLGLRDALRTTVEIYPPSYPEDDPRIAKQRLYTVASGDTLAAIASRFRVDIAAITRINDLDPKYALSPGQPLWIPQTK
jgi:hypothetical protein